VCEREGEGDKERGSRESEKKGGEKVERGRCMREREQKDSEGEGEPWGGWIESEIDCESKGG